MAASTGSFSFSYSTERYSMIFDPHCPIRRYVCAFPGFILPSALHLFKTAGCFLILRSSKQWAVLREECFSGVHFTIRTLPLQSCWLLSHVMIVETMGSVERGMNLVTMTIISPRKLILAEPGIELATFCSQILYTTDLAVRDRRVGLMTSGSKQMDIYRKLS